MLRVSVVLLGILVLATDGFSRNPPGFKLKDLPKGSQLTIPQPATTYASLDSRILLTTTERTQTLKFSTVNLKAGKTREIRVSIYDPSQERVQYIRVRPGVQAFYKVNKLSSISVLSEVPGFNKKLAHREGLRLMIESNKPLGLQH